MTFRRPRSIVQSLKKQYKKRQHELQRRRNRELRSEQLEDRRLLAGPELLAIRPDEAALLQSDDVLNVAPREFNLLFKGGSNLDTSTIAGNVRLVRAGQDGVIDDPRTPFFESNDDFVVDLGFLGIDDPSTPNPLEIVLRPASMSPHNVTRPQASLPDDIYQVQIFPDLMSLADPTATPPVLAMSFNDGEIFTREFRLDLGARAVAIVPQPVSRNTQEIRSREPWRTVALPFRSMVD